MTNKIKICVLAGMIDEKLKSKIAPLQSSNQIGDIFLIRRTAFSGNKIHNINPPTAIQKIKVLAEIYRFMLLFWVLIKHKPKLIIAFGTIPHGIYASWLAYLFNIPCIQHVMGKNDLRLTFPKQSFRWLALKCVMSGKAIAVRGMSALSYLSNKGVNNSILFTPQNLHDFNLFKPLPNVVKEYDLIYVGLISAYKRLDLMVEVIAEIKKKLPNIKLLIVGDGPLRFKIEQLIKQHNLENNIQLYGKCKFKKLAVELNKSKAFIMTSQGEGLPMAMIEALSCGLPVIVPDDADITQIAIDKVNARVVKQWTKSDFSNACLNVLTDPAHLQLLSQGALKIRNEKRDEYSLKFQTELWDRYIKQSIKKS